MTISIFNRTKMLPRADTDFTKLDIDIAEALDDAIAIQVDSSKPKVVVGYLDHNLNGVKSALDYLRSEEKRLTVELKTIEHHLNEIKVSIKGMESAETIMAPHSTLVNHDPK